MLVQKWSLFSRLALPVSRAATEQFISASRLEGRPKRTHLAGAPGVVWNPPKSICPSGSVTLPDTEGAI